MDLLFEIYYDSIFIFYYMYSEISIIALWTSPAGLRVQAPFGAVGIGTGTWAVLSSIPEGACACGAEGHMASIGPPALGAKGCVRSAQGGRRMAVRIAIEHPIGTLPRTPFCHYVAFPLKGKRGIWREKQASHILHIPFRCIPPLVPYGTTFPPQAGAL